MVLTPKRAMDRSKIADPVTCGVIDKKNMKTHAGGLARRWGALFTSKMCGVKISYHPYSLYLRRHDPS